MPVRLYVNYPLIHYAATDATKKQFLNFQPQQPLIFTTSKGEGRNTHTTGNLPVKLRLPGGNLESKLLPAGREKYL